jgi:hypothetical protein
VPINNPTSEIMKNEYTAEQQATIATATATIKAAAHESVTAIIRAKAHLTIIIREQVAELEAAEIGKKDIAAIVRDSIGTACKPSHISRTLTECGIRLRGKRSDAGHLKAADAALDLCREAKPEKKDPEKKDPEKDEDELDDDLDPLIEDGTKHTAETLAALLASIDPEIVEEALAIAGLA